MSDDPEQIRAQARRAARLAAEARQAATAVTSNTSIQWHSSGADRYRSKLSERAAEFRHRAGDFDELSRLLYSHARHVEDHERAIGTVMDGAGKVIDPLRLFS
ncbi:hypothetical protein [Flexivirga caeni]|uniref:Uncharacterized protein n=1 Tax=Flexivirga caeni TaxID=2294115 RepID=A0A3M9MIL1_9MICO|nr:hypothetical protein [Flexivirga caeni]RNI25371.1 hypothetical protein EFY87_01710 [Flexivirga caeni]